jgi:hypothetical protein
MALILRVDVDRPYGRHPLFRHVLSRLASDLYFPRIESFGYLRELAITLEMLKDRHARAYVFFRRCTLPPGPILRLIEEGEHEIGLHLENSRSFETFAAEKRLMEAHIRRPVLAMSKHGSGREKYGLHHYAPYEPERYVEWARRSGMMLFLGNLEDPSLQPAVDPTGFRFYPSAFWLEPAWRNTNVFTIDWLLSEARSRDVVLLIHPENVLAAPELTREFRHLLSSLGTRIVQ